MRIPLVIRLNYTDGNWTAIDLGLWLGVEQDIGILSACLPTMRPLFRKTFISRLRSIFAYLGGHGESESSGISERFPDSGHGGSKGGGKKQKAWFDKVLVSTSKGGSESSNTSEERMVATEKGAAPMADESLKLETVPAMDMGLIDRMDMKSDEEWQGSQFGHAK